MAQFNKIVYIIKNALYIRILHFEYNMIYIILGNIVQWKIFYFKLDFI